MASLLQRLLGKRNNTPNETIECYAMPEEIDTKEAANRLGLSDIYVRRMIRAGRISARKVRRDWLVDAQSLAAFMTSGRRWVVKKSRKRARKIP